MYVSLSPDPLRIGSPVPPSNPTIAESSGVCQSPASKKKSVSSERNTCTRMQAINTAMTCGSYSVVLDHYTYMKIGMHCLTGVMKYCIDILAINFKHCLINLTW